MGKLPWSPRYLSSIFITRPYPRNCFPSTQTNWVFRIVLIVSLDRFTVRNSWARFPSDYPAHLGPWAESFLSRLPPQTRQGRIFDHITFSVPQYIISRLSRPSLSVFILCNRPYVSSHRFHRKGGSSSIEFITIYL